MLLSTSSPVPYPPSGIAVANHIGRPGTIPSGTFVAYGRICSSGWRGAQPAMPANASDAPMTFRNERRVTGSITTSV